MQQKIPKQLKKQRDRQTYSQRGNKQKKLTGSKLGNQELSNKYKITLAKYLLHNQSSAKLTPVTND
jgi:hypothetical protein